MLIQAKLSLQKSSAIKEDDLMVMLNSQNMYGQPRAIGSSSAAPYYAKKKLVLGDVSIVKILVT